MKLNVHIIFLFLFVLSVIKPPVSFEYINVIMVIVTLLCILLLSLRILKYENFYQTVISKFKVELMLIFGYATVSLISMLLHSDAFFGSYFNLVFYGLSPIAIWCAMPLIWLIMRYSSASPPLYYWTIGWGVFIFMALVGIWQAIDFESSKVLTQFFVASDRLEPNVNSVTRVATDFGVIMALAFIGCLIAVTTKKNTLTTSVYFVMIVLFFIAGLLSGSRNFLITVVLGFLWLYLGKIKDNFFKLFLISLGFFLVLNLVAIANEQVMQRFSVIFPYLTKINTAETIYWQDLLFVFQSEGGYTSGREMIWSEAIKTWLDSHFWLGYSTRGFGIHLHYLELASIQTNAHNFLVQSIIDGGLLGFMLIISLVICIFRRAYASGEWPIFLTFMSSMLVDYYLDHSLPWMLCAGWILNIYRFNAKMK